MLTDAEYSTADHDPTKMPSAWAYTHLETFRKSIPLFHKMYVTREIERPASTPGQTFGICVHMLVFEPHNLAKRIAIAPNCDLRTKAGKEIWSQFEEANKGLLFIKQDAYDEACRVRDAVEANGLAWDILQSEGASEKRIQWNDLETGLPLKGFIDRDNSEFIVDLKTSSEVGLNPDEFGRSSAKFGYHRQAALYIDGTSILTRVKKRFIHVVVSTQLPYECAVFELSTDDVDFGRKQNRESLVQLRDCLDFDHWQARHGAEDIVPVRLPKWAYYDTL